jgi:hypothetical protein
MCKTPPAVSLVEGAEDKEQVTTHCNGSCQLLEKNGKAVREQENGKAVREENGKVGKREEEKGRVDPLLDRDWGSAIPEYIYSGCLCALVFIMGITIRGRVNTQVF